MLHHYNSKKFNNVKLLTHERRTPHEDKRRPITIGHLSDSGELKTVHQIHFINEITSSLRMSIILVQLLNKISF